MIRHEDSILARIQIGQIHLNSYFILKEIAPQCMLVNDLYDFKHILFCFVDFIKFRKEVIKQTTVMNSMRNLLQTLLVSLRYLVCFTTCDTF